METDSVTMCIRLQRTLSWSLEVRCNDVWLCWWRSFLRFFFFKKKLKNVRRILNEFDCCCYEDSIIKPMGQCWQTATRIWEINGNTRHGHNHQCITLNEQKFVRIPTNFARQFVQNPASWGRFSLNTIYNVQFANGCPNVYCRTNNCLCSTW